MTSRPENQQPTPPAEPPPLGMNRVASGMIFVALAAALLAGWFLAPAGLLGKADAIAYAVCHRLPTHSFFFGDRQFPLCARCTGTFLGAFIGSLALIAVGRGRSGVWPRKGIAILLGATVIPWGLDGANSYATLLPGLPHLYEPQNWLRVTTGAFLGLAVAALFLPAVNQSIWKDPDAKPILASWREAAGYFALAPLLIILILAENPVILYPLAVLSTFGVILLLTGVFATVVLMILRRESRAVSWKEVLPVLAAGLTLALLMIGGIDGVRYAFTHTWGGFSIGG
jgi:uncharacterized membrane protein